MHGVIGKAFGPIMALWFLVMVVSASGVSLHHPSVLAAINPVHGLRYCSRTDTPSSRRFLRATGAEGLSTTWAISDRVPRLAWSGIVFPSLVLNYAGLAKFRRRADF